MSEDEDEYSLVMPFVVCDDHGGPYKADAFVAGCYFGELQEWTRTRTPIIERYIPSPLLPQVDLLAMEHGYDLKSEPCEDHAEEWTYVELTLLS